MGELPAPVCNTSEQRVRAGVKEPAEDVLVAGDGDASTTSEPKEEHIQGEQTWWQVDVSTVGPGRTRF